MKKIIFILLIITAIRCTNAGKGSDQTTDSVANKINAGEAVDNPSDSIPLPTDSVKHVDSIH